MESSKEEKKSGDMELEIKPHSTIVVLGKRGTGKSVFSKWLIKHLVENQIYDSVYILSTTEKYSKSFDCVPPEYIVDKYDIKFVQSIIDSQRKMIEKYGKDSDKVSSVLLVLDDLLGSVQTGSHEMTQINHLFSTSRHINIGLLVCSQCSRSLVSPVVKQNTDYLAFRQINDDYLKSLYESVYWDGNIKSFMDFTKKALRDTTHEFIVYDNVTSDESNRWMIMMAEMTDFQISYGKQSKKKIEKKTKKQKEKQKEKIETK